MFGPKTRLVTALIVVTFVYTTALSGSDHSDDILTLFRLQPNSERQNQLLDQKRTELMIDFWSPLTPHLMPLKATVHRDMTSKFTEFLSQNEIKHKVIGDLSKRKPKYFSETPKPFDYENNYNKLNEIYEELKRLSEQYSDRLSVFSLGKSSENRDIMAVELKSSSGQKKKIVMFECGVHSREWISPAFCLWSINKLIKDKTLLDHYQFVIIPSLNPDGYHYTWTKDRYWRKNREFNNKSKGYLGILKKDCYGIDLNRNFETQSFCKIGSSPSPCDPDQYCGSNAFSAPETTALKQYVTSVKDSLFVYLSIHAYSQFWLYSYGYTNDPPKNKEELHNLSAIAVQALEKVRGTKYKFGGIAEVIYPVSGSSVDWVYDKLGVNYSFALELPDTGDYGFELPESEIKPVSEETWTGIEAMLRQLIVKEPKPESAASYSGSDVIEDGLVRNNSPLIYKFNSIFIVFILIICY